jgi:hypothetical protein
LSSQNDSPRTLIGIPVEPSTTALGIHAPLGVQSKTLASRSMTEMCVVSFPLDSWRGVPPPGDDVVSAAFGMFAILYFQALTF